MGRGLGIDFLWFVELASGGLLEYDERCCYWYSEPTFV